MFVPIAAGLTPPEAGTATGERPEVDQEIGFLLFWFGAAKDVGYSGTEQMGKTKI